MEVLTSPVFIPNNLIKMADTAVGCGEKRNYRIDIQHKINWPERHYYFSKKYGFIFCTIHKCGSTSLLEWLLRLEGVQSLAPSRSNSKEWHDWIFERFSLMKVGNLFEVQKILKNSNYFKFTFVRHPLTRVVSAYIDKFVRTPKAPLLPMAEEVVRKVRGFLDPVERITFRQFVNYLVGTDDLELDDHWRPQYLFLKDYHFDFIGKLEQFNKDMDYISKKIGINYEFSHLNPNPVIPLKGSFFTRDLDDISFADMPVNKLCCKLFPPQISYYDLYDKELTTKVIKRFWKDIETFGYDVLL